MGIVFGRRVTTGLYPIPDFPCPIISWSHHPTLTVMYSMVSQTRSAS